VKNILIADDEEKVRKFIGKILQDEDFRLFFASNGKEALDITESNSIDLVIIDINMPVMSGTEAAQRIRENDKYIEIVMITGYGELENLNILNRNAQIYDYILKPFEIDELKTVVRKALEKRNIATTNNFKKPLLNNRIHELETDFEQRTFELRKLQVIYKDIVQTIKEGIVLVQDGDLKFVNNSVIELSGYTQEEMLKIPFTQIIHPDDRETVMNIHRKRLGSGDAPSLYNCRVLRKDGLSFWVENHELKSMWKKRPAILIVIRDISVRIEAEKLLRESEERYRTIFVETADGIVLVNSRSGRIIDFNNSAHKNLGYTRVEFAKLTIPEIDVLESSIQVKNHIKKIMNDGFEIFETKHRKKDGEIRDIKIHSKKVFIKGEEYCLSLWRDITTQKKALETVLRAEKLSSLGKISAGLAHELRNPLAVISSCSQFCLDNLELDRLLKENLQVIYRNSQNANRLITELLAFASPSELKQKKFDINNLLDSVVNLTKFSKPVGVTIVSMLKKGPLIISGDEDKIGQVMLNVIQNAIQALPGKGKVIVKTRDLPLENMVEVNIIDKGSGIPEEYRAKIFNPFFTTKEGGTGLGLSVCDSIIKQHMGRITIESEADHGTMVSVKLPVKQAGKEKEDAS